VETRNDDGTQLGAAVKTTYHTDVFAQYGAQADAEIAKIIEQNEVVAQIKAAQPAAKSVPMRTAPATLAAR
jgi:membrane fusion protein, multidrug efflux system